MRWGLPCKSRGVINSFNISFHGVRSNYSDHIDTMLFKVEDDLYDADEVFDINLGELNPLFNYTYKVAAKAIGSIDLGEAAEISEIYPPGSKSKILLTL